LIDQQARLLLDVLTSMFFVDEVEVDLDCQRTCVVRRTLLPRDRSFHHRSSWINVSAAVGYEKQRNGAFEASDFVDERRSLMRHIALNTAARSKTGFCLVGGGARPARAQGVCNSDAATLFRLPPGLTIAMHTTAITATWHSTVFA